MLRLSLDVVAHVLVLGSIGFWLVALLAARSFVRSRRRPGRAGPTPPPPVSLLVPLCGADAHAEEVYAAFCRQDYPQYQVVFGVRDPDDPSTPLVERLIHALPDRDVALVLGGASIGANPKVSNLYNMLPRAKYETLVLADADVLVSGDFLARVVPPLADPRVGLVTCLYRSYGAEGPAARLEAVGIAGEFAPRVLVARFTEGVRFALGATMATTKTMLRSVGGLPAVADYLADDFQLGRLIVRAGREVRLSSHVVQTVVAPTGIGAMLRHQLRWSRTIRACRPGGYLGLLVSHSVALALLALLLDHGAPGSFLLPGMAVGLQLLTAWIVGALVLGDATMRRDLWLLPLRDLLGFFVWCVSLFGRTVEWRGRLFTVTEDGKLVPQVSGRFADRVA